MDAYTKKVRSCILPAFNDGTPADRIRPLARHRQRGLSRTIQRDHHRCRRWYVGL